MTTRRFAVLKTFLLIFLISFLLSAFSQAGIVKIGIYENLPKITLLPRPAGIYIDIIEYIAQEEGWEIIYVEGNWTECLERLEKGEIDIMVDVAFSDERAVRYDFNNQTVFVNWGRVYAASDIEIASFLDLENKTIAVMKESIHTNGQEGIKGLLKRFDINASFIEVNDYEEVFKLIESERAHCGVVNRTFGDMFEDAYDLKRTSIIFNPAELRFAFPKGAEKNNAFIEKIDYHLIRLKKDPHSVYYSSLEKHLGKDIVRTVSRAPKWILWMLVFLLLLTAVISAFNRLLQKKVDKRTEELRKANEKLKKADELKTNILSNISHELKTPLVTIRGYTELLAGETAGTLAEKQKEQLKRSLQSADRLTRSIDDLLFYSVLLKRKAPPSGKTVHIKDVLSDVLNTVKPLAAAKDVSLNLPYEKLDTLLPLSFEEAYYILYHLISNAVKFNRLGGKVDFDASVKGKEIILSVSDEGGGIDGKKVKNIYEPFYQADSSLTRPFSGMGLGLAICRQIAESRGGRVEIKKRPEGGSTAFVYLPAAE